MGRVNVGPIALLLEFEGETCPRMESSQKSDLEEKGKVKRDVQVENQ